MSRVQPTKTSQDVEKFLWDTYISKKKSVQTTKYDELYKTEWDDWPDWLQTRLVQYKFDKDKHSKWITTFLKSTNVNEFDDILASPGKLEISIVYSLVVHAHDTLDMYARVFPLNSTYVEQCIIDVLQEPRDDILAVLDHEMKKRSRQYMLSIHHPHPTGKTWTFDNFKDTWDLYPDFPYQFTISQTNIHCLEFEVYTLLQQLRQHCPKIAQMEAQNQNLKNWDKPIHMQPELYKKLVHWYLDSLTPSRQFYVNHLHVSKVSNLHVSSEILKDYASHRYLSQEEMSILRNHCSEQINLTVQHSVKLSEVYCRVLESWVDKSFVLFCQDLLQHLVQSPHEQQTPQKKDSQEQTPQDQQASTPSQAGQEQGKRNHAWSQTEFFEHVSFAFPGAYTKYYGYRNLLFEVVTHFLPSTSEPSSGDQAQEKQDTLQPLQRPFFLPESYDHCDQILAFYYGMKEKDFLVHKKVDQHLCTVWQTIWKEEGSQTHTSWWAVCNPVYAHLDFFHKHGTHNRQYVHQFLTSSASKPSSSKPQTPSFGSQSKTLFVENIFEDYMDEHYKNHSKDTNSRVVSNKDKQAQKDVFVRYVLPEWMRGCDCTSTLTAMDPIDSVATVFTRPWKTFLSQQEWIIHCGYSVYACALFRWLLAQQRLWTERQEDSFVPCPFPLKPIDCKPDIWQDSYTLYIATTPSAEDTQQEFEDKKLPELCQQLIQAWETHTSQKYDTNEIVHWQYLHSDIQHILKTRHPKVVKKIKTMFALQFESPLEAYQDCDKEESTPKKSDSSPLVTFRSAWQQVKEKWNQEEPCLDLIVSLFPEAEKEITHLSPIEFWQALFKRKEMQNLNLVGTLWEKREQLYYLYLYKHQLQYVVPQSLHLYWPDLASRRPFIPHTAITLLRNDEPKKLFKLLNDSLQSGDYLKLSYRIIPENDAEDLTMECIIANEIVHCCRYLGTCWFAADLLSFYLQDVTENNLNFEKTEQDLCKHLCELLHTSFPNAVGKDISDLIVFNRPDIMSDLPGVQPTTKAKNDDLEYVQALFNEQSKRMTLGESVLFVQTPQLTKASKTCFFNLDKCPRRKALFQHLQVQIQPDSKTHSSNAPPFLFYSQCEMRDHVSYDSGNVTAVLLQITGGSDGEVQKRIKELLGNVLSDRVSYDPVHHWKVYWEQDYEKLSCPGNQKSIQGHFSYYLKKSENGNDASEYKCGEYKAMTVQALSQKLQVKHVDCTSQAINWSSDNKDVNPKTSVSSMLVTVANGIFGLSRVSLQLAFSMIGNAYHVIQTLRITDQKKTSQLLKELSQAPTPKSTESTSEHEQTTSPTESATPSPPVIGKEMVSDVVPKKSNQGAPGVAVAGATPSRATTTGLASGVVRGGTKPEVSPSKAGAPVPTSNNAPENTSTVSSTDVSKVARVHKSPGNVYALPGAPLGIAHTLAGGGLTSSRISSSSTSESQEAPATSQAQQVPSKVQRPARQPPPSAPRKLAVNASDVAALVTQSSEVGAAKTSPRTIVTPKPKS